MREDHAHTLSLHQSSAEDLLEWVPDAVVVSDSEGRIVFANGQAEALFGYARTELVGRPVELLVPEHLRPTRGQHRQLYASRPRTRPMARGMNLVGRRKDGTEFQVEISLSALGSDAGPLVTSFIRDVSERLRLDQDLRQSGRLSHAILNSLDSHIIVVDGAGTVIAVNDAWKRFAAEVDGKPFTGGGVGANCFDVCKRLLRASADVTHEAHLGMEAVLDGSRQQFTLEYPCGSPPDGSWSLLKVTPLSGGGRGVVIYHVDITERKRAEQTLREQARRDRLTGALNHGAIADVLRDHIEARQGPSPLAVAMVDLDGLRTINDTYGHAVGDAALIAVSKVLAAQGAVVGRYGGDEFVAILVGADRSAAVRYQRAVIDTLAEPHISDPVSQSPIPLRLSIGLAFYPEDAQRIDELFRLADAAMHSSRRDVASGRTASSHALRAGRAAATLSEIVPLLMAMGDLREKLRLVAHRVSVGAGYDLVGIELFGQPEGAQAAHAFARLPDEVAQPLIRDYQQLGTDQIRHALERARRPILIKNAAEDQRFTPAHRALLDVAGVQSMLLVPVLQDGLLVGMLSVGSREPARFGAKDVRLLGTIAEQVVNIARMSMLVTESQTAAKRANDAHAQTVMMLAATAEAHDQTTGLHLRNVQALSDALARELGYGDEAAREVGLAAVLHDIGKIRVPKEILLSPDELSDTEWAVVKQHTVWGAEFLVDKPMFERAAVIARCHHERWDGGGYPAGLRGDEIPEEAAIVTIADAFDAMTHDRPYRPALARADAIRRVAAGSGTQFSPKLVAAFLRMHDENPLDFAYQDDRDWAA